MWGTVLSAFYAVNVQQRADKTNEEHANAMRGLTGALGVFTAVQGLDQIGLWSWLATWPWPAVWGWLTTLPNLVR